MTLRVYAYQLDNRVHSLPAHRRAEITPTIRHRARPPVMPLAEYRWRHSKDRSTAENISGVVGEQIIHVAADPGRLEEVGTDAGCGQRHHDRIKAGLDELAMLGLVAELRTRHVGRLRQYIRRERRSARQLREQRSGRAGHLADAVLLKPGQCGLGTGPHVT